MTACRLCRHRHDRDGDCVEACPCPDICAFCGEPEAAHPATSCEEFVR